MLAIVVAAVSGCGVSVHPDTSGWKHELEADSTAQLVQIADCEQGVWSVCADGSVTASKDRMIWLRGEYGDFELDFEYRLEPAANSGVVIRCDDVRNWIPNSIEVQLLDDYSEKWRSSVPEWKCAGLFGHLGPAIQNVKPAGEWNRMTIRAEGRRIRVAQNGEWVLDADTSAWTSGTKNPNGSDIPKWLSRRPMANLALRGRIGFQGMHGGAKPYFRNVRIRGL